MAFLKKCRFIKTFLLKPSDQGHFFQIIQNKPAFNTRNPKIPGSKSQV